MKDLLVISNDKKIFFLKKIFQRKLTNILNV